ncbi:endonuclease/glycosyl hydrolase [Arabidopsis thaliana]|uniref:Endonuclease/glycosyl hydrolase n=1 Tax=Arabidopsis thaliana TaxID=3702 RepID=Q58G55_ARATH|nr:endonuclease/glycosyl hydrolase [Arabidopsis thaliana]AAX55080.1 hypothetical protein At1g06810 [Arabidopsis thaliana]AEE28041.1 endonuclease/glycosyl hydrolase [Arabidopsis thaliana]|eukprot:NP_172166.2 endonuclease/glycosyl hydrolase [Arabidopsis thaliana]
MKRILRKLGYNGPVTITAVGSLAKVPRDILEAVSSTGISLYHEFYSRKSMVSCFLGHGILNPRPSTMMVISRPPVYIPPRFYSNISRRRENRYNSIFPFPLESPREASSTLWKKFLLADPGPLDEEDSCSETPGLASWLCSVCRRIGCGPGIAGQGVDNFITHISTREHELNRRGCITPKGDRNNSRLKERDMCKEEHKKMI